MKLMLLGYGRMGTAIDTLARKAGHTVPVILTSANNQNGRGITAEAVAGVDVAVDFSTAEAVVKNLVRLASLNVNAVIGTTGWNNDQDRLRRISEDAGITVVAAPNFSIGVNLFLATAARMTGLFAQHTEFKPWIHEIHHAAKKDAPSGTAIALQHAAKQAGYQATIDTSSNRSGYVPGTHTIAFDGPDETVTLAHATRNRETFARGALFAATMVHNGLGKTGFVSMAELLGVQAQER